MVLGETEITAQIRNACETARAGGLTGRVLNRFFQKAFQAAKEIRTRTETRRRLNQERGRGIGGKNF
jgi:glutamyl-tRNA reductase